MDSLDVQLLACGVISFAAITIGLVLTSHPAILSTMFATLSGMMAAKLAVAKGELRAKKRNTKQR